jgi:WD40 repeat protein
MSDGRPTARSEPKLPWGGTVIALAAVMVLAVARPLMPHGIVEFVLRTAGVPLTLNIGDGRSVRLVKDRTFMTRCEEELQWSPDGTVLFAGCGSKVQAWTLDGDEREEHSAAMPLQRIQALGDPLRLAYEAIPREAQGRDIGITIWNVLTGTQTTLPIPDLSLFALAQERGRTLIAYSDSPFADLKLISLGSDSRPTTLPGLPLTCSVAWLPGDQGLLQGGYDGVLRRVDIATEMRLELAKPYATSFPKGGGDTGCVNGLALGPDGRSVAIFMGGGAVTPIPGTNTVDGNAEAMWEQALGNTVQIRSVDDGRLLARMPGEAMSVDDLVWDPLDRFIAVSNGDAVFLWHRQNGQVAIRSYDEAGLIHSLAICPDGSRLAVATGDSIQIFRIEEK